MIEFVPLETACTVENTARHGLHPVKYLYLPNHGCRVTTESVLQLLLDKQSERDDADSLSEYRMFVGRLLIDSEIEEECMRGSSRSGSQHDRVKADEEEVVWKMIQLIPL